MPKESEYVSSTHPPVQLHCVVPKPWVLDTYSMPFQCFLFEVIGLDVKCVVKYL